MSDGIFLDNDVVLKMLVYGLHEELIDTTTVDEVRPALLAVAKFTLRSRIKRKSQQKWSDALETVLKAVRLLEPSDEEIALAADLEQRAAESSLEFDSGESQLVAMVYIRFARALITGDKRAMRAIAHVMPSPGKFACLEQVAYHLTCRFGYSEIRNKICSEPKADRALTICFSCTESQPSGQNIDSGLKSYVDSLRQGTEYLLIDGYDLSAIVP